MTLDGEWREGLSEAARALLPAPVSAYVDSGSFDDVSRDEAVDAWRSHRLWPHVLRDVSAVDVSTRLLGRDLTAPIGIAPTSMQRSAHPDGELAVARAAAACGVASVVSSNAGHPFADIGASGPWWLQLYLPREREAARPLLEQAVSAGAEAIVLTVDTPEPGPKPACRDEDWADLDIAWHRMNLPSGLRSPWADDLVPDDIGRVAEMSGVPVIAKGVLRPGDARRCVEAGAQGVWVSNHGGRQLDRSVPTGVALPGVVAAVGEDVEVYVDGGVRSGLDVLTALALGADGVFLGRPVLRALAVAGEQGVRRLLTGLSDELRLAMRLSGAPDIASVRGLATPE